MLFRFLSLVAVASLLVFAGCESGSSDSGGDVAVVNYAGTYSNNGKPLAPQQSGTKVTTMSVIQEGDALLATDNNGINFRGSISPEGTDGLSPFNISGKTSAGTDVNIVGAFSRDGSRARMNGNWIEPTHQSTFNAYSGTPPPEDVASDVSGIPATPAPNTAAPAETHSADLVNAPASFTVEGCTFKDDGDVGGWPITTIMRSVKVSGSTITMVYDNVDWPKNGDVNGNCWYVYEDGGRWVASTFDYLKPNQETKEAQPGASNRGIRSGDQVGVFVSTLARDDRRNGDERSQIYWLTWP